MNLNVAFFLVVLPLLHELVMDVVLSPCAVAASRIELYTTPVSMQRTCFICFMRSGLLYFFLSPLNVAVGFLRHDTILRLLSFRQKLEHS